VKGGHYSKIRDLWRGLVKRMGRFWKERAKCDADDDHGSGVERIPSYIPRLVRQPIEVPEGYSIPTNRERL
jgi:hypothetical protein